MGEKLNLCFVSAKSSSNFYLDPLLCSWTGFCSRRRRFVIATLGICHQARGTRWFHIYQQFVSRFKTYCSTPLIHSIDKSFNWLSSTKLRALITGKMNRITFHMKHDCSSFLMCVPLKHFKRGCWSFTCDPLKHCLGHKSEANGCAWRAPGTKLSDVYTAYFALLRSLQKYKMRDKLRNYKIPMQD